MQDCEGSVGLCCVRMRVCRVPACVHRCASLMPLPLCELHTLPLPCAAKMWSIPQYLHMLWSGPFQASLGVQGPEMRLPAFKAGDWYRACHGPGLRCAAQHGQQYAPCSPLSVIRVRRVP